MDKAQSVPKTCKECYGTKKEHSLFKLPQSQCPYEIMILLRDSNDFFKDILNYPLSFDINQELAKLLPKQKVCLASLPDRAQQVLPVMMINELKITLEKLQNDIAAIKNRDDAHGADTTIYKPESMEDAPLKIVKKPDIAQANQDSGKFIAKGGWKNYQRNVTKKNVGKYMKELAASHPELKGEADIVLAGKSSGYIKVSDNAKGNKIISYRDKVPI